jgi:alpha-D-ribose 1-methylphosphonate 5-triphosphate synthase subunit PhnH
MNDHGLRHVVAGFAHESYGSQAVFRAALDALSHPGRPLELPLDTALPRHGHGAAAALLLGLLDADTSLWLSPRLAGTDAADWLRFHTGCAGVSTPQDAQFLWVAQGDALPDLSSLRQGTDEYPDQSATCVLEVNLFQPDTAGWTLQGPGILGQRHLQVQGLPEDFSVQWLQNHASFPRGVDVFLSSATHIVGLPRTTRLLTEEVV